MLYVHGVSPRLIHSMIHSHTKISGKFVYPREVVTVRLDKRRVFVGEKKKSTTCH
jgi:hypothetical protein